jgi:pimeloyl-ACP methyl ester carboxylesterase
MTGTPHRIERPGGVAVAYHVHRPPVARAAPALLLVHGLASNASRFEEFAEHTSLAGRHVLMRIDLRGHGGSFTRTRTGIDLWCDDIAAVLDAESAAPALLVGHSLGAQVVLHAAARQRRLACGLVLIDPVFRSALHGRWLRLAQATPLLALAARTVRGFNAVGVHRGRLPALNLRALDDEARRALRSPEATAAFVARYSSAREDLRHLPLAVYLQDLVEMFRPAPLPREIGLPTLALLSTGATFAEAAGMRAALAAPNVEVQSIDCQHWPLTERPLEVRRSIERWCEALAGTAGD